MSLSFFTNAQGVFLEEGESGIGLSSRFFAGGGFDIARAGVSFDLGYTHNAKFDISGGFTVGASDISGIGFTDLGIGGIIGVHWLKQPSKNIGLTTYLQTELTGGVSNDGLLDYGGLSLGTTTYLYKRFDLSESFAFQPYIGGVGGLSTVTVSENIFGTTATAGGLIIGVDGGLTGIIPFEKVVLRISGGGQLALGSIYAYLGSSIILKTNSAKR